MSKPKIKIRDNPFEPRPESLPIGDDNPHKIYPVIGEITTVWEGAEISYSYLFSTILRPTQSIPAARRAYGSIISAKSRRDMIEGAGEVFFHLFPNARLEQELGEFLNIYMSAANRRNEIAHGVIVRTTGQREGWYLEANTYSRKRDMNFNSPYAYTGAQMHQIASRFSRLRTDVEGFRSTLKEHFLSCDPRARARY